MSRRLRLTLFFFGLFITLVALWLLVAALFPSEPLTEQATLAPTLFTAP